MFDNYQISIYWNVGLDMQTVVFMYEPTDIRDGISHILALQTLCFPKEKKIEKENKNLQYFLSVSGRLGWKSLTRS